MEFFPHAEIQTLFGGRVEFKLKRDGSIFIGYLLHLTFSELLDLTFSELLDLTFSEFLHLTLKRFLSLTE